MEKKARDLHEFKYGEIVWVPKVALSLYSTPGTKHTEDLWDVGIIMDMDNDGNARVYVDGKYELTHSNFIRPMGKCLRLHHERRPGPSWTGSE